MKRFGGVRHYLTVLAAVATFGVGMIVAAGPANAVTWPEICAQNGTGYCMNLWNGFEVISVYTSGVTNDAYAFESINPCNSTPAGRVTETCPFTVGSGMNSFFVGDKIVRIRDKNNGACVATDGQGHGLEGFCGNANAAEAANGVIDVQYISGQGGFNLANRYWSNHFGQAEYITSPGVIGDYLIMYWGTRSTASSWSQVTLV